MIVSRSIARLVIRAAIDFNHDVTGNSIGDQTANFAVWREELVEILLKSELFITVIAELIVFKVQQTRMNIFQELPKSDSAELQL